MVRRCVSSILESAPDALSDLAERSDFFPEKVEMQIRLAACFHLLANVQVAMASTLVAMASNLAQK